MTMPRGNRSLLLRDPDDTLVNLFTLSAAGRSLTLNAKPDAIWSIVAYPMSKAALNMLTIQYARAFPRWRVNSATPGLTLTEFTGQPTDSVNVEASRRAGGKTVDEAVAVLVAMATVATDGPYRNLRRQRRAPALVKVRSRPDAKGSPSPIRRPVRPTTARRCRTGQRRFRRPRSLSRQS